MKTHGRCSACDRIDDMEEKGIPNKTDQTMGLKEQKDHYIASPQQTIRILQENDFQFKKQLGQNFLIDLHVLGKIMDAADVGAEDLCLEIGPGIGSLTQVLAERAQRVVAVEIDERLISILAKNLKDYDNVTVVSADFLKLDLPSFFEEQQLDRPVKVIANLPYYITTPIIMGLFESHVPLESLTVMVQEEVARRMKAGPGSKDYGALSLAVQYYAEPYIAAHVPLNCFIPRPKVGSAVIRLTRRKTPPVEVKNEKTMFGLIRAAFGQRRKTLVNSLTGSRDLTVKGKNLSKEEVLSALSRMSLDERVRGEQLDLSQYAQLSDELEAAIQ